ncbi:hypothetical protein YK48G_00160 [Lentilactobacillus fungorum]|uniref:Tyr recombinase domain-containing protein n=1 Tax=Lentilactobacillus fungorum TaxID=2201250 RepID=A0ABQ3VVW8_9LACO|nr:tyrosine-type recombinase/integrase [Lentilactobacillus fungorum]GHP12591.1 hypothetical protein YK48G_00160 [Lentilactobacillus fungorum]
MAKIVNAYIQKKNYTNPQNFVVYSRYRWAISPTRVNTALHEIYDEHIISKRITFHGLRHTHTNYLINPNEVSFPYISRPLEHANTVVTLKIYSHLFKSAQQEEAQKQLTRLIIWTKKTRKSLKSVA